MKYAPLAAALMTAFAVQAKPTVELSSLPPVKDSCAFGGRTAQMTPSKDNTSVVSFSKGPATAALPNDKAQKVMLDFCFKGVRPR